MPHKLFYLLSLPKTVVFDFCDTGVTKKSLLHQRRPLQSPAVRVSHACKIVQNVRRAPELMTQRLCGHWAVQCYNPLSALFCDGSARPVASELMPPPISGIFDFPPPSAATSPRRPPSSSPKLQPPCNPNNWCKKDAFAAPAAAAAAAHALQPQRRHARQAHAAHREGGAWRWRRAAAAAAAARGGGGRA
jgi:hypothetical protein